MATPLSEIPMSPKSRGALQRAGYETAEQALAADPEELLALSGVTETTLVRLTEATANGSAGQPSWRQEALLSLLRASVEAHGHLDDGRAKAIASALHSGLRMLEGLEAKEEGA